MDRMILFCFATFCGAFIGIYFSQRMQYRYVFLTEMDALILKMEGLIKYNRYSVYELLDETRNEKLSFITDDMIAQSKEGKRIDELWKNEISDIKYLTADDLRVLGMLGDNLGKTDTDGQLAVMESVRRSLDTLIKDSDEIRKNKMKLYRTLGILLGAAVGIVLL